jgi:hypothetical protein
MGADVFEISAKLGITVEDVSELLMSHLRRIESQPVQQKGFYRAVSVAQLNKLIGTYLEVALLKEVVIERFRAGESVTETDCAYPLSCAAFCLAAIRLQTDLLGLKIQEQENSQALDPREMLAWMRNQMPLINEIVRSTPPDTPDLPVERLDGVDSLTESEIETPPAIAEFSPAIAKFDKLSARTKIAGADDDLATLDIALRPEVAAPPPDPLVQAEIDRTERRRRFFAGEPDGL